MTLTDRQLWLVGAGLFLFGGVLGFVLSLFTGVFGIKSVPLLGTVVRDTSVITIQTPLNVAASLKPVALIPYRAEPVTVHDTTYVDRPYIDRRDSLVYIPISKGMYTKNDVTVWATGYKVSIDSVRAIIPVRERTITNTITKVYDSRITLGVNLSTLYTNGVNPVVAAHFSYDKGRLHTFARAGVIYLPATQKVSAMAEIGTTYNLFDKKF